MALNYGKPPAVTSCGSTEPADVCQCREPMAQKSGHHDEPRHAIADEGDVAGGQTRRDTGPRHGDIGAPDEARRQAERDAVWLQSLNCAIR